MSRSQNYATNNTFILGNKTNIVLETTNGGQSYTAILLPCATGGGISMIESDAYYFYNNTNTSAAAPYFGVSTSPYTNAVFTPAMTGAINSLTRSGFDATHKTFAIGTTTGQVYQSIDGGLTFNMVGTALPTGVSTDKLAVSYDSKGILWVYANGTTASNALPTGGIYEWIPASSSWVDIGPFNGSTPAPVSAFPITGDGTMYATGDYIQVPLQTLIMASGAV